MSGLVIGIIFIIALLSAVRSVFGMISELLGFLWRHKFLVAVCIICIAGAMYVRDGNSLTDLWIQIRAYVAQYI